MDELVYLRIKELVMKGLKSLDEDERELSVDLINGYCH